MSVLKLNEPYNFPFGKLSPLSHEFRLPLLKQRVSRIDHTTKYAKSISAYVYAGILKHNYVILDTDENNIFKIFEKKFDEQISEEFKQDLLYYINETYTKGSGDAMRRSLVATGNSPIQTNDKIFYPMSNYMSSQWLSNLMMTLRNRVRDENKISSELESEEKQQNYFKKIRAVHNALQTRALDGRSLEKYFNKNIDELYSLLYPGASLPAGDFTKENIVAELKDKENEQYIKFIVDNPFYDGMIALCVHNGYFNKDKFDEHNLYTIRRAFLRSLKDDGDLTTDEVREFLNYVDESFDRRLFYFYQLGEISIPSNLMIDTSKPMRKGEMTFEQIKDAYEKNRDKSESGDKIDSRSPPHAISSHDNIHSIFYGEQNSIVVKAFKRMFSRLGISLGSIDTNEMNKIYKDSIYQYLREKVDKRVKEGIRMAFKSDNYLSRLLVSTIDAKFSKHSISYNMIEYENDDDLLGTGDHDGLNLYGNALIEYRDILLKANVEPLEHDEYVFPPRKTKMSDVFTEEERPFMMKKIDEMMALMISFHTYQNKVLNQSNDVKIEECYFVRNLLMRCVECIKELDIPVTTEMPDDFSDYMRHKGLRIPKKGLSYLWEYISSTHQMLRSLNINLNRYGEILRKFEVYSSQRAKESMQIPPLNKFLDGSSINVNYKNHIANAVVNIIVVSKKYFKTFYEKAYIYGYQVVNEDVDFAFRVLTSSMNYDVPIMIEDDSYYSAQRFLNQFIQGSTPNDVALLFKNIVNSLSHLDVEKQIRRFQSCETIKKFEDSIDMFEDESRDIVIEGDELVDEEENVLDKLIEEEEDDNLIKKHYKESKDEEEKDKDEEEKDKDEDEDFAEEDENDGVDYDQQFSDDDEY